MINFQQFPIEVQDVIDNNNSLQQALNRLEHGTKDTKRSWFYEDEPNPEDILSQVTAQLDGMKDLRIIADWDLSKVDKFGPQGGAAPLRERLDLFEEYFLHLDKPAIVSDPLWQEAKKRTILDLGFNNSGVPLTLQAVIDNGLSNDKYYTNSGFPLYTKRKNPEAIEEVLTTQWECIGKRYPFTLGTRAQMGKTGAKARSIFMAPMAVNVCGQSFALPLQDYIRQHGVQFFIPWEGWSKVQEEVSTHWNGVLKFGADYTKMDQHFNKWHGLEVYDVIKHYFRKEYWDQLKLSITYLFNAPILTNLGYVYQEHAMPSGSEWTNFLETMWNYIFIHYLQIKYHLQFTSAMGIGDDQLYFISGNFHSKASQDKLINLICSNFDYAGLPGNPEKQEVGYDKTSFLQRLLTTQWSGPENNVVAAGVYSLVRDVTSEVFPEFWHNEEEWSWRDFVYRGIQICENAFLHPLFPWYVKFVFNSNANFKKFCLLKEAEIIKIEKNARKINNLIPTYNQEKQNQSILNFATYKLMRKMALDQSANQ